MKTLLSLWILKLVGRLPLGVGRGLGGFAGFMVWLSGGRSARITRRNLTLCQPRIQGRARERLVRRSLTETGKTLTEAAMIWHHGWPWLRRRILAVEGEEALRQALAQGRGVVLLAPHLGNWEAVGPCMAEYGRLTALYQPPRQPALEALIVAGRLKGRMALAPTTRRGVAQLLKALERGEMVGILPDQVPEPGNGGEVAPFFGQPALTMTLVYSLVRRTGCRVVCTFAQRVPGGYRVVYLPADERVYAEDVATAVAGLNGSVEQCVRRAPAQYQWEYKRFRRLPPEYPDPYRQ